MAAAEINKNSSDKVMAGSKETLRRAQTSVIAINLRKHLMYRAISTAGALLVAGTAMPALAGDGDMCRNATGDGVQPGIYIRLH